MNTFFSIYRFFSTLFMSGEFRLFGDVIPLWFFWLLPIFWPVVIPTIIVLCLIVMWLSMLYLKIDKPLKAIKKTIIRVSFFGFLCDLIVVGLIVLIISGRNIINQTSDFYQWYYDVFLSAITTNSFSNVFAFLTMSFVILLSRVINYKLNKRYSFSKLDTDEETKKKLALYMAIFTAPYIFLFSITV